MFYSRLLKYYIIILISSLSFLLICLFFCYFDEYIIAEGEIRPFEEKTTIKCLFTGTITDVCYKKSMFVNQNEILFILDSTYERQELERLLELQKLYIKTKDEILELLNCMNLITIYNTNYEQLNTSKNIKCAVFISEYTKYKNNYDLSKMIYENGKNLYPLSISQQELQILENTSLQNLYDLKTWINNERIQTNKEYLECLQNLEQCNLDIYKYKEKINNSYVRASTAGFINELVNIKVGDYLYENTEILNLIPQSNILKCIVDIPNTNISKIKENQKVFLKIDDLPFTYYGNLTGYVSYIPSDISYIDNINNTALFSIEVILDKNYLEHRNKNKVFLHIGTKAKARIIVDKYTIIQKFFQTIGEYANY